MNVVSIPTGAPFLETLAGALIDSLTLADDIVLLPTHRAGRALVEAFAEAADGGTLLLPRVLSLGELDADEIAIRTEAEPGLADDLSLKPAIPALARRLLLARLVMQRDRRIPPDRALQLAGALARLIDEVQFNRLDFSHLETLVAEEFAEHWQETLDFLAVVTEHWPAILEDEGRLDPIDRRNRLYEAQIALWRRSPPEGRVIAAGSTGIMPATADLLACIAGLPRGLVVLPGLDRHLDDRGWEAVEEGHPQWALKRLLERLGVERGAVPDWPEARPA
ncbi:MAG: double-strand break repair protein AddB, partial [Alphaproteobacteria bacterium]|nr:double-strand break repair protein AddB [Alphaproteobacteria bacterium]